MSIWSASSRARVRPQRTARTSSTWGAVGLNRETVRVAIEGWLCLQVGDELIEGTRGNLSEGGAFIRTPTPPELGTDLRLTIELAGGQLLTAPAVVRRVDTEMDGTPRGCGLEFGPMSAESRGMLREMLTSLGVELSAAFDEEPAAPAADPASTAAAAPAAEAGPLPDTVAALRVLTERLAATPAPEEAPASEDLADAIRALAAAVDRLATAIHAAAPGPAADEDEAPIGHLEDLDTDRISRSQLAAVLPEAR